jgi:hypothetical protein
MFPPKIAIDEATRICLDLSERSDKPLTTLVNCCETLRKSHAWDAAAVWLVERRVLQILGQLVEGRNSISLTAPRAGTLPGHVRRSRN